MRSFAHAAAMVALTALPLTAQSPSREALEADIDQLVAPLQALDVFDGIVVVAERGRVVAAHAYGMASREFDVANRPTTSFRIASISKPFTRLLVGRLAERGTVEIDAPIARWLPDFPSADRITVRMLLDHRAGVPSRNSIPWDEEAIAPPTLSDLVDSIARMPLDFEPGSDVAYTNGGYAVLARVLELADGRAYADMIDQEIVRPLGLQATRHEADGDVIPGVATGYMPSPQRPGVMVRAPFQSMDTKTGGGSLVSSAPDLILFLRALRRDPILGVATWDTLFPARERFAYQGRAPGFNVFAAHDVTLDRTVVVLANNYTAGMVGELGEAVFALAAGSEPAPLPVHARTPIVAAELPLLSGSYVLPEGLFPGDPRLTIDHDGGYLVARIGGAPVDVLLPQGGRAYLSRAFWSIITFDGGTGERANALEVRALYNDSRFEARRER